MYGDIEVKCIKYSSDSNLIIETDDILIYDGNETSTIMSGVIYEQNTVDTIYNQQNPDWDYLLLINDSDIEMLDSTFNNGVYLLELTMIPLDPPYEVRLFSKGNFFYDIMLGDGTYIDYGTSVTLVGDFVFSDTFVINSQTIYLKTNKYERISESNFGIEFTQIRTN